MNNSKNKVLMAISVLLMLSFVVSMIAVPSANAQTNGRMRHPFIDLIPNVVGVGQAALVNFGAIEQLSGVADGWNVTLTYVGPDGKSVSKDYMTFSTGTRGQYFTFTEPGNYTFSMVMEAVRFGGTNYTECRSENVTLEVREDYWKMWYPGHSMPAEYWTRPVDSQLREWYSIMGSWVNVGKQLNVYSPYNDGPETGHILWSMPMGDSLGGLGGGEYGVDVGMQTGDAYEGKFVNSVVVCGNLYYNRYVSGNPTQEIVAVDLHTGKILWERSYNFGGSRIARGQVLHFDNYNSRGVFAYIWMVSGSNWFALDAANGDLMYNMTNVPSGTVFYGPSGEMLIYSVAEYGGTLYLQQWNSTHVVNKPGVLSSTGDAWGSRTRGATYNTGGANAGQSGYDINVSTGVTGAANSIGNLLTAFPCDRVIYGNYSVNGVTLTGISLDSENRGYVYFNKQTWKAPDDWKDCTTSGTQSGFTAFSAEDKVIMLRIKEMLVDYAFSAETGKYMWETEPGVYADAWSGATAQSQPEKFFAYGKYYSAGPAGVITCHDAKNGTLIWEYQNVDQYTESYLRENWWSIICAITDGKIYIGNREHSPLEPKPRGAPFLCLDAETGDLIWEIDGAFRQTMWGGRAVMGDSIIATMDTYDQQIYAIGKGPSELSVSVSNPIATAGVPVMISGTVMDVSPGTKSADAQLRFPKGVPAVSDASQSEWMLYVYKAMQPSHDITGIDISVYAYDTATEEVIPIGTAQSDSSGRYAITWTPTKAGTYDVYAYFEGTGAFYGDTAKSETAVFDAPVTPPPEPTPPYEWYIIAAAIIVIVVNLIVALLLRKK
jgi:hypothetical protein